MEHVYTTMKSVIAKKALPVSELQRRIDIFYAQSKLTEDEKFELEELIFLNKTVDAEKASLEARYEALLHKYDELAKRVTALEKGISEPEEETDIPDWTPWNGVSNNYQTGAIVKHKGKTWKNVLSGMQNVWEPGTVDERYWIELT
jgi:predicted nuclease with TOPRIM domain